MKINQLLNEQNEPVIDNRVATGIGATGYSQDIDYFGKRMKMKPTIFLKLTSGNFTPTKTTVEFFRKALKSGEGIGAPFLIVEIPDGWFEQEFDKPAKVSGHEGRHRMYSILQEYGDIPVETHLILRGKFEIRARRIEDVWIEEIRKRLISQFSNEIVPNPFS